MFIMVDMSSHWNTHFFDVGSKRDVTFELDDLRKMLADSSFQIYVAMDREDL